MCDQPEVTYTSGVPADARQLRQGMLGRLKQMTGQGATQLPFDLSASLNPLRERGADILMRRSGVKEGYKWQDPAKGETPHPPEWNSRVGQDGGLPGGGGAGRPPIGPGGMQPGQGGAGIMPPPQMPQKPMPPQGGAGMMGWPQQGQNDPRMMMALSQMGQNPQTAEMLKRKQLMSQ